jgi:hypothetical protein
MSSSCATILNLGSSSLTTTPSVTTTEEAAAAVTGSCVTAATATGSCGVSGGYISITNPGDLASINECTALEGDVIITPGAGMTSVNLPSALKSVGGSLVFDGQNTATISSISAPGLTSIGSTQSNGAQGLTDLVTTNGLAIGNFKSLTSMLFPNLVSIQANFMVENNPQLLGIIDMPELSNVGGNIDLTGTFNSVDLPALTKINIGNLPMPK